MMVNGLTLDKKGFENDRERLLDAIAKGNELKERFIDVMNRDSEVFDGLIESLALPKDDDAHKAIRRGAVQASFRSCTQVPLTMMEICSEAIDLCAELVGTTNPNVVSDLGIAALTLKTAMQSAWLNVLINLSSLKDKAFRDECCQKGEALLCARCTHRPGELRKGAQGHHRKVSAPPSRFPSFHAVRRVKHAPRTARFFLS